MIILDASALLAYLFREEGHQIVAAHLESACISAVNLSEVAGRLVRDGLDADSFVEELHKTSIEIVPFTELQSDAIDKT